MAFIAPQGIPAAASESGAAKAEQGFGRTVIGGVLAGAYIAFGGLLAVVVSAGLPKAWGNLPLLITGGVFTVGLMLVVIAGAELATGNMATVGIGVLRRRVPLSRYSTHLAVALVGNLIGALLVAYFLGVKSGVLTQPPVLKRLDAIATLKGHTETDWQVFLRGVGCNWLVCLAVWMALAAKDVTGKIVAIFFPVMAFVAMGFDHVVANMFFLPAAIFAHGAAGITWTDALGNWAFALVGNLVGAGVFVAGAYWYLYGREAADAGETATLSPTLTAPAGVQPATTGA